MQTAERNRCALNGKFVEPCPALVAVLEEPMSKHGISHIEFRDMKTGERTRSLILTRSGEYRERGIVLNFCPFCGTPIEPETAAAVESDRPLNYERVAKELEVQADHWDSKATRDYVGNDVQCSIAAKTLRATADALRKKACGEEVR